MTASPAEAERPPQAVVMQMMTGAWVAQTISAVTRLDVPDLLHAHGPLTARELTERHGVDAQPGFLERALRACASVGVFTESADGRFGPTPMSDVLRRGAPGSVRRFVELIGGRWWGLFASLPDAIRTGQAQVPARPEHTDEDRARHREAFGEGMTSRVESTRGVLAHWDFSGARTIADVGGGLGHQALAILARHPHVRAAVLDLPEVIEIAERHAAAEPPEIRDRLAFVAGDMFVEVPPADVYLLKAIVHDWDDGSVVRVLSNCRAHLQGDGRVLCVDNVLPPMGDTSCSGTKFLDMLMMVSLPGRERTEPEWRALYEAAGLRVESITRINPRSGESIVAGRRVDSGEAGR